MSCCMSCCMCVACVLHVRCMSRATQITSLNWGSGTSVVGESFFVSSLFQHTHADTEHDNYGWQARDFGSWEPKSAITSESILCVQYVLMHLEMHNVSPCPRGHKGQEAEKQTKGWMLFCVFLSRGEFFLFPVFFNIDTQIQSVSVCVCWKRLETKKTLPGFFKKNSHPQETP